MSKHRQSAAPGLPRPAAVLAKRPLLHDRLSQALARDGPHRVEVLLLDLENFKR